MTNVFEDIVSAMSGAVPLLETIAPTIATMVGGPLAGTAVGVLEKVFGLTPGAGPAAVSAALATATPDQLTALKKVDDDFKVQMQSLDVQVDAIDEKDRESARSMQEQTKDKTPDILAYFLTFGFFGILALMIFVAVPPTAATILNVMVGFLGNAWMGSIGFFFGSNRDSQNKSAMLFNSTPATTTKGKK